MHLEERTRLASKQMLLWMNLSSSSQEPALQKKLYFGRYAIIYLRLICMPMQDSAQVLSLCLAHTPTYTCHCAVHKASP